MDGMTVAFWGEEFERRIVVLVVESSCTRTTEDDLRAVRQASRRGILPVRSQMNPVGIFPNVAFWQWCEKSDTLIPIATWDIRLRSATIVE